MFPFCWENLRKIFLLLINTLDPLQKNLLASFFRQRRRDDPNIKFHVLYRKKYRLVGSIMLQKCSFASIFLYLPIDWEFLGVGEKTIK